MGWPQITFISLLAVSFAISAVKHGEARPPYSVWAAAIGVALNVWLLHAGGFWSTP